MKLLNWGVGEDSWESHGLQGDPTSPSERKSVLNIHWKDWSWSWNSISLATRCKKRTHVKIPWCRERLKAGGEEDNIGWDGHITSLIWWTWIWVNSGSWWWTGRPGVLQSMGLKRVRHDWATKLNWYMAYIYSLYSAFLLEEKTTLEREKRGSKCWNTISEIVYSEVSLNRKEKKNCCSWENMKEEWSYRKAPNDFIFLKEYLWKISFCTCIHQKWTIWKWSWDSSLIYSSVKRNKIFRNNLNGGGNCLRWKL